MSTAAPTLRNAARCIGSKCETHGIEVVVTPSFVPEQSDSLARRFIFRYTIRISNRGKAPACLVARRWLIVDANGSTEIVEGEGVVGQKPRLAPGQSYEYSSFCPLRTSWGTMEGAYSFRTDDGAAFQVPIARFYLVGT